MSYLVKPVHDLFTKLDSLDSKQVYFVTGFPKSGTTWVEKTLDSHASILCKGEAHFPTLLERAIRQSVSTYNARIPKKGNWSKLGSELPGEYSKTDYRITESELSFLYEIGRASCRERV